MGEEQRPGSNPEKKSGFSQLNAMHIVIIIGIIVLAAIFIAKFGFGTDLINPTSGEMAIAKPRPLVTPVRTIEQPIVRPDRTLPVISCTDTASDPNNCGSCGNACSVNSARKNVAEYGCSGGKCTIKTCQPGYGDCSNQGTTDINGDGCETELLTGKRWTGTPNDEYVGISGSGTIFLLNPTSCGSCGNSCGTSTGNVFAICDHAVCKKVCWSPWLDCNNNMNDGCEQVFDNNNCGACGAKCPSGYSCNVGCCQKAVMADYTGVRSFENVPDSLGGTCRQGWIKISAGSS